MGALVKRVENNYITEFQIPLKDLFGKDVRVDSGFTGVFDSKKENLKFSIHEYAFVYMGVSVITVEDFIRNTKSSLTSNKELKHDLEVLEVQTMKGIKDVKNSILKRYELLNANDETKVHRLPSKQYVNSVFVILNMSKIANEENMGDAYKELSLVGKTGRSVGIYILAVNDAEGILGNEEVEGMIPFFIYRDNLITWNK